MLALKIIGIAIMALIMLGIIAWCQEELKSRHDSKQTKIERARREMNGKDWRKVGVIESYHNRKMMEIAYGDICPICGEVQRRSIGDGNGPHYSPCTTCEERYEQDRKDGVFPPGISPDNKCYNSVYYYALRLIEYELRTGAIDAKEARVMQQSLIQALNEYDTKLKHTHADNHLNTSYRDNYLD